jgi:RNA polymerase sigma-70 factor (ECF subfamily)
MLFRKPRGSFPEFVGGDDGRAPRMKRRRSGDSSAKSGLPKGFADGWDGKEGTVCRGGSDRGGRPFNRPPGKDLHREIPESFSFFPLELSGRYDQIFTMDPMAANAPSGSGSHPSGKVFPVTRWSLILGLQASSPEERQKALDTLCKKYWKPILYYLRQRWSRLDREGQDLTQAFFAWILENPRLLERYNPERAGFRAYLKVILEGFAKNENDARHALKRGGASKILSMDQGVEPLESFIADPHTMSPEQIFDLALKKEMWEQAVEIVKRWYISAKQELRFQVFEADFKSPGKSPSDAELARRFGISESMVGNYKFDVRERIYATAREELRMTVADPERFEEEWNDFLGK